MDVDRQLSLDRLARAGERERDEAHLGALHALQRATERAPEGVFGCEVDDDCPPELVCRTNVSRCFRTRSPVDAGE